MNNKLIVHGTEISVTTIDDKDYISLTDMLRAKDGDFFISDWLRNRNTVEFLGIWEQIHNPDFNYGEFAAIRSQAGLNSYCGQRPEDMAVHMPTKTLPLSSACGSALSSKSI